VELAGHFQCRLYAHVCGIYPSTSVEFPIHNLDSELIDHVTLVRRQVPGLLGVVDLEVKSSQELFFFGLSHVSKE
jgi:hypothetical protein